MSANRPASIHLPWADGEERWGSGSLQCRLARNGQPCCGQEATTVRKRSATRQRRDPTGPGATVPGPIVSCVSSAAYGGCGLSLSQPRGPVAPAVAPPDSRGAAKAQRKSSGGQGEACDGAA